MDPQSGCWIWTGATSSSARPYGVVGAGVSKGTKLVHRLTLEASLGRQLGAEQAHHKCANTLCVNPNHLQPVTDRENIAEMNSRNSYLARLQELERTIYLQQLICMMLLTNKQCETTSL